MTTVLPRSPRLPVLVHVACAGAMLGLWVLSPWNVRPATSAPISISEPADNSTPDVGDIPATQFPALQRQKHLARLGVDAWHRAGQLGKGVKVAILDTGFRSYRDHLGTALPKKVTVKSFRLDGEIEGRESLHGVLCGEVLHALAPEAELLLANWEPDRSDKFLEAVRWAREQGAKIISCSVIMPSWSDCEGHGDAHDQLAKLLGPGSERGDLLCFASAGNIAQRHWVGEYHAANGWHEWRPGRAENLLTPWGNERISVEVCWQSEAEYEVVVHDTVTGDPVGKCERREHGSRCAYVRFQPAARHTYTVSVRLKTGKPGPFHLVALGGGLHYAMAKGSIAFPADGPEVIAVGAVDTDQRRVGYSSCGPNSSQPKPDLVAEVPFPSLWRAKPFAGTSAAAPQAAGLAAVLWGKHPEWTAKELRAALAKSAQDLLTPGHDTETGYGLIGLPADKIPN